LGAHGLVRPRSAAIGSRVCVTSKRILAHEKLESARALLGRVKLAVLDPRDREAFAGLTSRLEARESLHRLTSTYETAAAEHDHFRARDAARWLAATAGADPDGAWRRAAEMHGARIRSAWALPDFDMRTLPFSYLMERFGFDQ